MKKSFRFDAARGSIGKRCVAVSGFASGARQGGFTLIEVMVALIVLVLGVLGAAAMTLTAIRDSKQSGVRTQASALAYEISDLMRANRYWGTLIPANYPAPQFQELVFTGAQPTSGVSTCWTTGCIPSDMAKNDLYEWLQKLKNPVSGLPNGVAVICHDAANPTSMTCDNLPTAPIVVKLRWDEKKNNARDAAATTTGVVTQIMVVSIDPYQ